jgi:hypothetical protein
MLMDACLCEVGSTQMRGNGLQIMQTEQGRIDLPMQWRVVLQAGPAVHPRISCVTNGAACAFNLRIAKQSKLA